MAAPDKGPVQMPKRVRINFANGMPSVDNEAIELWSTEGEQVEWVSDHNFVICFPRESPFESRHFHTGSRVSGKIRPGATGRYKYNVEVNGQVLDPTVIIKP